MYDTETIAQVIEDIRCHESGLTERQESYVEACEEEFERTFELSPNRVARLYEILDDLDERAGGIRADDSEDAWWRDNEDDDYGSNETYEWDEADFWR